MISLGCESIIVNEGEISKKERLFGCSINLSGIAMVSELDLYGVLVNTDEFSVTVENLSFRECTHVSAFKCV